MGKKVKVIMETHTSGLMCMRSVAATGAIACKREICY